MVVYFRSRQEIIPPATVSDMTIFTSPKRLVWGELDVPLLGLSKDHQGAPLQIPVAYSLVSDGAYLWYLVNHRRPARLHPKARPGAFQAELWQHDVAELFISDPVSGRYFEFNLAPNGAWWNCEFTAPRVRAEEMDIPMPQVATFADIAPDGSWLAAMAIPLSLLRARLDFGLESRINVTLILESPAQKFVSTSDLGEGPADFHQPDRFSKFSFFPLPD
jgi:hypothetical protein